MNVLLSIFLFISICANALFIHQLRKQIEPAPLPEVEVEMVDDPSLPLGLVSVEVDGAQVTRFRANCDFEFTHSPGEVEIIRRGVTYRSTHPAVTKYPNHFHRAY